MRSGTVARGFVALACLSLVACNASTSPSASATPSAGASNPPPASASASSGSQTPAAPYTVGFLGPLTGDLAFVGTPYRDGLTAYIQYVNTNGGVNGHQIVLKTGDDQDKPATAAAVATQHVQQDHAIALVEGGTTTVVESLNSTLDQFQVPLVSWSCLPGQIFEPMETKFCYDTAVAASSMGVAQVAYALKLKPNAKILLVPTSNPYGEQWLPAATKYAQDHGGTIVAKATVPLAGVDMTSIVSAVSSSKPDVVVTVLNDNQAVTFGQGLKQQGLDSTPVVNYISGSDKTTFSTLKNPNFYALRVFPYADDQSTDGMKQYVAATTAAKLDPNAPLQLDGYFAAHILIGGIAACGDGCTGAKLATTFDSLTIPMHGLAPDPFTFSATNHQGLGSVGVYQADSSGVPKLLDTVPAK